MSLRCVCYLAMAVLLSHRAAADPPAPCDMRLTVRLTPDVSNPSDVGFLSSLLSGHPGYQLTLLKQTGDSVVVVELIGPGPRYVCHNVVVAMRKDGRVRSVQIMQ